VLRRLTQWSKGAYKRAKENMNHMLLGGRHHWNRSFFDFQAGLFFMATNDSPR